MRIHLINPSDVSFGVAVITPRWLYVLAAATPKEYGDPHIVDETLEQIDFDTIKAGDVVGIGIHTLNALRGYEVGRAAKTRGAHVIYGGIHTTLYPDEMFEHGGATAVVKGDGDRVWPIAIADVLAGTPQRAYEGGRLEGGSMLPARWDLLPRDRYMFASVQTVRGCPKHCSFCSVWRTDGQKPRVRASDALIEEMVQLRRIGFRFITLADDNFYPVTLEDLRMADRRADKSTYNRLKAIRDERFELMEQMAKLPPDTVFFTQITMEAAEDPEYLEAMRKARIRGWTQSAVGGPSSSRIVLHHGWSSSVSDCRRVRNDTAQAKGKPRSKRTSRPTTGSIAPSHLRPWAARSDLSRRSSVFVSPDRTRLNWSVMSSPRGSPCSRSQSA